MPRLPVLSGREIIEAFGQSGFEQVRNRGSHVVLRCGDRGCVVPLHREVAPGTLVSIMRTSGLALSELLAAR